jgi:hypothetical protein
MPRARIRNHVRLPDHTLRFDGNQFWVAGTNAYAEETPACCCTAS